VSSRYGARITVRQEEPLPVSALVTEPVRRHVSFAPTRIPAGPAARARRLPFRSQGFNVHRTMSLRLAAALVFAAVSVGAQSPAPARSLRDSVRASKRIVAVRAAAAPVIDGRLDDAAWAAAPPATDFTQKDPAEGTPPTDRLAVRFAYDDAALYVAMRVILTRPREIRSPLGRRDNIGPAEHFWISLDTYHDERTAYTFGLTPHGVRGDHYNATDDERDRDTSFEPVWQGAAQLDSTGWSGEMRIPFSQLRFNDGDVQRWGVNINFWNPASNEDVYWVVVPKKEAGWSSWMGELAGISGIPRARRLELLPYVASEATVNATRAPANPFDDGRNVRPRIGGDLKMGIGPGLTLQATVNPDFGQVEADPAEVNLSAFESIFDERRPFFVEGSQLLSGPANYFYSRRIGASPRGSAVADFVDYPQATTILGAAKVTGRLPSGTSVGLLTALTGREEARLFDSTSRQLTDLAVAPRAAYVVGRVQQQFGANASTAGISITGVERQFGEESRALRSRYTGRAWTGGADFDYRFAGNRYTVNGFLGGSIVQGDTLAITALQRSSARYFQRPDARGYHLDRTRTALSGYTAALGVSRNTGRHWLWEAEAATESPALELNDVGRIGTADGRSVAASLKYRETERGRWLRRWDVSLDQTHEWNFDGDRQDGLVGIDGEMTFRNFWELNVETVHRMRATDARATRGGPLMGTGYANVAIVELSSSFAASTRWKGRVYYGRDEFGAPTNRISGSLSVRPSPQWQLTLEPTFMRYVSTRQYVDALSGGTADTYGTRYVFGRIDQSTFFADLRLNYVFKPDLSLELYAQPFAASGRYTGFGELAAARSRELRPYGTAGVALGRDTTGAYVVTDRERPGPDGLPSTARFRADDFNLLSMRSNAVLRWEYRPGSTLFVVWQQNRERDDLRGDLVSFDDVFRSFGPKGSNFFAVKANFWVPVR
jgi:hypothetical protein